MTETMSAKIYQFPAGGRSGMADRGKTVWPVASLPPMKEAVSFGSGWYHEEAILQDELEHTKVRGFPARQ